MKNQLAILNELDKTPYATGSIIGIGTHLHTITTDEADHVPPVSRSLVKTHACHIVMPTAKDVRHHAKNIRHAFELASEYEKSFLLFLCSKEARKEDIALIAAPYKNIEWAAIDGPFCGELERGLKTSNPPFAREDTNDIAQKRNFGLQFARSIGWKGFLFLDDDVVLSAAQVYKIFNILEREDVNTVGFNANNFPDLSVTVHARRWATGPIDSFIGGGALAIKVRPEVSFFPHLYSEDWFFLIAEYFSQKGKIVWAGNMGQDRYDPYANLQRARSEEVGDILGEGLLKLVMTLAKQKQQASSVKKRMKILVDLADEYFWQNQINDRITFIQQTRTEIEHGKLPSRKKRAALRALAGSLSRIVGDETQVPVIASELADWMRAWMNDLKVWSDGFAKQPTNLSFYQTLENLKLNNSFIYNSGSSASGAESESKIHSALLEPPTQNIELENTTLLHKKRILQGIRDTAVIEGYLKARNQSLAQIVMSADLLRGDRPMLTIARERPEFTLSMHVVCGESMMDIIQSVRSVVHHNTRGVVMQIIVWVNGVERRKSDVAEYRNILVARLINELRNTPVRLYSSIASHRSDNIDQIIQHTLQDIIFAYWKMDILMTHPIFVINSRNELLRYGSFGQFAEQEHSLSHKTLQEYLDDFFEDKKNLQRSPLIYDEQAVYIQSQRNLMHTKQSNPKRYLSATLAMIRAMKRASLTWTRLDELAHNVRYHVDQPYSLTETTLAVCMTIQYDADSYQLRLATVKKIIDELSRKEHNKRTNYMLVVRCGNEVSWEDIEKYRRYLTKRITQLKFDIIFTSLVHKAGSDRAFRRELRAIARYVHWLQDHRRKISVKMVNV